MRLEILLSLFAGLTARAELFHRQQQPPDETPSPIPRPTGTSNSSSPNLTPYKIDYFHLGMEYAALDLCGLDPYAIKDAGRINPSYCLVARYWAFMPDLTELNSTETFDYVNSNWTSSSVQFSLRALYTGLFARGILPEALRDWASQDPRALPGMGNLSDDDKRAIGELVARERANGTKTISPPEDMRSSRAAEVTAQMLALESWDRHRRSALSSVTPVPTAAFALGAEDKKEVFLVLSSALPQVFGKLGGPRNETEKRRDPKSMGITETYLKSPFVPAGPNARVLWYTALTPEELSGAVGLRAFASWGLWMGIWGLMGFVAVL